MRKTVAGNVKKKQENTRCPDDEEEYRYTRFIYRFDYILI